MTYPEPRARKRHKYRYRRGRCAICVHCGTKRRPRSSGYEYQHPFLHVATILSPGPGSRAKKGDRRRWWSSTNPPCMEVR